MPRDTVSRALWLCLSAALAGLILSACGSGSHSPSSAGHSRASAIASATAPTSRPACTPVPQPAPRRAQHVPRPRGTLSANRSYIVTLHTNCGQIQIRLDTAQAPRTTASFAYLVRRGFYNGLTFHNIAVGFAIQGGDPNGDGSGGPGYTIVEKPPADLHYRRGTVAMAKSTAAPAGSSGSQFFIVTASQPPIPHQYALVGKVVGGYATVRTIAQIPTEPAGDGTPKEPVVIEDATLASSAAAPAGRRGRGAMTTSPRRPGY